MRIGREAAAGPAASEGAGQRVDAIRTWLRLARLGSRPRARQERPRRRAPACARARPPATQCTASDVAPQPLTAGDEARGLHLSGVD
eukprot:scaffold4722_cov417-Prasinococcus_capsulatus_cf.AAC.8